MANYRVGTASIAVTPNLKHFREKLRAQFKKETNGERFVVNIGADTSEFEREKRIIERTKLRVNVELKADWNKFWHELQAGAKAASRSVSIDVSGNTAKAKADIDALERARKAELSAGVSTGEAEASLAHLFTSNLRDMLWLRLSWML